VLPPLQVDAKCRPFQWDCFHPKLSRAGTRSLDKPKRDALIGEIPKYP
jgi:hypothetical protein